jgi:hypothetical protein
LLGLRLDRSGVQGRDPGAQRFKRGIVQGASSDAT